MYACAPSATKTVTHTTYDEDLSIHRNTYPEPEIVHTQPTDQPVEEKPTVEPVFHLKSEMDSVLHKVTTAKESNYVQGLTIQVYSGNNREMASEVKTQIFEISEDYSPETHYDQPNYKVTVGQYFSRIEASKDYNTLKQTFTQALLVPKKIRIPSDN
jgi:hypothetical protein